MNSVLKWSIAVVGWIVLLVVFAIWKDVDARMGNGAISGFIRGALVFGGIYMIYRWVRGGGQKEE